MSDSVTSWTTACPSVGGIFQARIPSWTSPAPHCTERRGAPSWAPCVDGSFPPAACLTRGRACAAVQPPDSSHPLPLLSLPSPSLSSPGPLVVLDPWVLLTLLGAAVQEQGFAGWLGAGNRVHPPGRWLPACSLNGIRGGLRQQGAWGPQWAAQVQSSPAGLRGLGSAAPPPRPELCPAPAPGCSPPATLGRTCPGVTVILGEPRRPRRAHCTWLPCTI